jgi:hypothetical protein
MSSQRRKVLMTRRKRLTKSPNSLRLRMQILPPDPDAVPV